MDKTIEIKLDRATLPKDGQRVRFKDDKEEWHVGYFVSGDDIFSVTDSVWFFSWHVHEWEYMDDPPPVAEEQEELMGALIHQLPNDTQQAGEPAIIYEAIPVEKELPPYPQIVTVLLDGRMEMQAQIRPGDNGPEWWTLGMAQATNIECNKKCVTHWLKRL